METEHRFESTPGGVTQLTQSPDSLWLSRLFGSSCGHGGRDVGAPRCRGLAVIEADTGRFEADGLKMTGSDFLQDQLRLAWETHDGGLRLESTWDLDTKTGIWSRQDILSNTSSQTRTILGCLARFVLSPGNYELYSQSSRWCQENQGRWQRLDHGTIVLACEGARTTQGGTPYACIREVGTTAAIAFHVVPQGNWTIKVSAHSAFGYGRSDPFCVIELGLRDEHLRLELEPGTSLELPEILIQAVPAGQPELAAPHLHRYLLDHYFTEAKTEPPVCYNTWFDVFPDLDVSRLQEQLVAAAQIGCEVFVVDAGWFGRGPGWSDVGDWREKQDAAFYGRMADFADEVRAAGLGFGVWIEPEKFAPQVPVAQEHHDWLLPGSGAQYYPDLTNDEAYQHVQAQITRLVEDYGAVWIKIDFNHDFGTDDTGGEFYRYYGAWYRLQDELQARYPEVFFEGCASGGLRHDLNTLRHCDGHFLSDTVNPVDVLRIYQGALLRLPPGYESRWATLRPAGNIIPTYGTDIEDTPTKLVAPGGAIWEGFVECTADFASRVNLPGTFGLSGDIAGLPPADRDRLALHIDFFKKWRGLLRRSVAHLLTPARPQTDRSGWAAVQLQDPVETTSLVFVYRLDDAVEVQWIRPRELIADRQYAVSSIDEPDDSTILITGEKLMREGLLVELATRNSAAVFTLVAQ